MPVSLAHYSSRPRNGMCTYPVNRRLDIASSQEAQCIARINSQTAVQRLGPLPLACFMVLDLECCHGLSEEKCNGTKIGVAQ